jgi:hypothetical protein
VGAIYRKQSAVLTIVQDVRDTRESEGTAKILDAADIQKGSDEGGELSEGDVGDDPTTRVSRDIDGNDVRNAPHHSKGPSSLSFGDMALLEAHAKKLGVKMTPWPWTVHFGSHKSILQDSAKYLTLGSQQKRRVTPPRGIPHSDRTKNPVAQEPSPRRSSSGSSESARESSPKERKAIVDSKNRERYGTHKLYALF